MVHVGKDTYHAWMVWDQHIAINAIMYVCKYTSPMKGMGDIMSQRSTNIMSLNIESDKREIKRDVSKLLRMEM